MATEEPSHSDKRLWQEVLTRIKAEGLLRLGEWTRAPHKRWTWFFDSATGNLYHRTAGDLWYKYEEIPGRRTRRGTKYKRVQPIIYEEPNWTHRAVVHAHRATHIVTFQGAALKEPAPSKDHDKSLTELIDDDPDA